MKKYIILSVSTVFSIFSIFSQNVSYEAYVLLPNGVTSYINSRIISVSSDNSKIYVGISTKPYTGDLSINYGIGQNLEYSVYEWSNDGVLLNTQDGNLFHLGVEYLHQRIITQQNNTSILFSARPDYNSSSSNGVNFITPCSRIGLSNFNLQTQTFSSKESENCLRFNHFYSGFVSHNEYYALYNDNSGDKIRKWNTNLEEVSTHNLIDIESIPYVNQVENLIYYISNKSIENNELTGTINTVNFEGIIQNTKTFTSSILAPRLIASNQYTYLIQPNKNQFIIQRVNQSGIIDKNVSFLKTFYSAKLLSNGNLLVVIHDKDNLTEPNRIFLLGNDLEIIGSIAFGVPYSAPVNLELVDSESVIYISGVVETSLLFNEEERKCNDAMLIKINMSSLQNSLSIEKIISHSIKE